MPAKILHIWIRKCVLQQEKGLSLLLTLKCKLFISSLNNQILMKKKMMNSKLSLDKKQVLVLDGKVQHRVKGGVDTKANCPPSVGCTQLQVCITCNCPDW